MLPLIARYHPGRVFAWRGGEPLLCGRALTEVQALARRMAPNKPYINLCEDRYRFTLAFAAVALAGGFSLLPQSRAAGALVDVQSDYTGALTVDDDQVTAWLTAAQSTDAPAQCPSLTATRLMAVVFTSGSTGRPARHRKYWGDLALGTALYQRRFFATGDPPHTLATVPPQHMYGLETSVLPALRLGFAADAGRPFMPWTVAEALARLPAPRLLITTPVHLQACFDAGVAMPELAQVISATAPLEAGLAQAIERAWQTRVHEIYGSTETGSIASRRTATTDIWTLYDGMSLAQRDAVWVSGPQLQDPFRLSDDLEVLDEHRFRLLGRAGDMLKTAGKRLSINELTRHLLEIEGVEDAVVFRPSNDAAAPRPAALVVAPALGVREIAARLALVVDPVFVPRPLLRVGVLPRNALGKLPRDELLALLQQARGPGT